MAERVMSFIVVREQVSVGGHRPTFAVINRAKEIAGHADAAMGVIRWMMPFQQWCFFPSGPGVMTGSWMLEIVEAIKMIANGTLMQGVQPEKEGDGG